MGGALAALGLDASKAWVLEEMLADATARGIEMGFAMSDFIGDNPVKPIDAYNAGIVEGKKEG